MDNVISTKAASKFLTWIFGKDSTAIATWATLGLGWMFYQYVYKPERAEERKARVEESVRVAAENAKSMSEMRAMADAREANCDKEKDRLYKGQEALMQRMDRMLDQQRFSSLPMADATAAGPPELECP